MSKARVGVLLLALVAPWLTACGIDAPEPEAAAHGADRGIIGEAEEYDTFFQVCELCGNNCGNVIA